MKSLSVNLGVILAGALMFGYAEAWGADWKPCFSRFLTGFILNG